MNIIKNSVFIIGKDITHNDVLSGLIDHMGCIRSGTDNSEDVFKNINKLNPSVILIGASKDFDPFKLCKEVREQYRDVSILLCYEHSIDYIKAIESGATDCFDLNGEYYEMLLKIRSHLVLQNSMTQIRSQVQEKETLISENEDKARELMVMQKHLIETEKMSSLSFVISGIAQEFNMPLRLAQTSSAFISERTKEYYASVQDENSVELIHFLHGINSANDIVLKNLNRLQTSLMEFKQFSIEQIYEQRKYFLLRKTIKDTIAVTLAMYDSENVITEIEGDEKLVIHSYPETVSRIIIYLVGNSLIHGFNNGNVNKITVIIERNNDNIEIKYMDNGSGIDKRNTMKIFDPFFTTDKTKGPGLGLYVAYHLVNVKLSGTIILDEKNDEGVVFYIKFPIQ